MNRYAKISVAMAVYNGERFIEEQIVSIAKQTVRPDEIIICDDGSTDNSELVIKQVCEQNELNFIYIKNEVNLGFNKNFEKAISQCTGDVIFICDQDDVWKNDKIELVMNVFAKHEQIQLVFHDAIITDSNLSMIYPSFWQHIEFDGVISNLKMELFLRNSNKVQGAAIAIKRNFAIKTMPFLEKLFYDQWLAFCGCYNDVIYPLNIQLIKYRQHDKNAVGIGSHKKHKKQSFKNRMKRLALLNIDRIDQRIKIFKLLEKRFLISQIDSELKEIKAFFERRRYAIDKKSLQILMSMLYKKINGKKVYSGKMFWHDLRSMFLA